MRTVQESLFQAAPASMTLPELLEELTVNFGVPSSAADALGSRITDVRPDVKCAGHLCNMSKEDFDKVNAGSLDALQINSLCIVLGSSMAPHLFAPVQRLFQSNGRGWSNGVGGESDVVAGQSDAEGETTMKLEGGKYKGGILTAKAECLEQRRTPLIPGSYHVPSSFDAYHHSVPRSEESGLRKLIVQAMLEMCGDLYPDSNERSVILGAIELYCGKPGIGARGHHWDNYRDVHRKRHLGSAVSDLHKARVTPAAYGVTAHCVPGRIRPVRLARAVSSNLNPAACLPPHTKQFALTHHPPAAGAGANNQDQEHTHVALRSADAADYDVDDCNADLVSEEDLLKKVEDMKAALNTLQEKQGEKKAEKAAAAQVARAEKAEKAAAAKEAKAAKKKGASAPEVPTKETRSAKKQKGNNGDADLCDYEKQRQQNIIVNQQWMSFIDATGQAGCKILDEEVAQEALDSGSPWQPCGRCGSIAI